MQLDSPVAGAPSRTGVVRDGTSLAAAFHDHLLLPHPAGQQHLADCLRAAQRKLFVVRGRPSGIGVTLDADPIVMMDTAVSTGRDGSSFRSR